MTAATTKFRWLDGAENVPATEEQIGDVLALGIRCVEAHGFTQAGWDRLIASALQYPPTVASLREILSALFLHTAFHAPELGNELARKNDALAEVLRLSE